VTTVSGSRGITGLGTDFGRFWASDTVSMLGTQVTVVALPVLAVSQLNATTVEVGVLVAAQEAAWLLIGLPAGAWVDRWRRRRVLMWSDIGRGLLLFSIPAAAGARTLTMTQLWLVSLAVGALTVFSLIAGQAYLPSLVGRDELVAANTRIAVSQSTASVAGPGLGGLLVQAVTAPVAIALDAVSYLASASLLGRMRAEDPKGSKAAVQRRPLRAEIGEGLRYVFHDPVLRALTGAGAGLNFCVAAQQALVAVFLLRTIDVPTGLLGVLLASGGLGGIVGGALAGRLARLTSSGSVMRAGLVLGPLGGLFIPAAGHGWAVFCFALGYALLTAGIAAFNVITGAFRQAVCPPELIGRMAASTRMITWGALPLGGLAGGLLGEAFGARTAIALVAAGFVLVPCGLLPTRLWRAEELEDIAPAQ